MKRALRHTLALSAVLALPAAAQSTPPRPAPAAPAPAERARLDELRRRLPAPPAAAAPEPRKLPPPPEYVTLNGVVRRSDGETVVWLNDKPVRGNRSDEGVIVSPKSRSGSPAGVTVIVPQTGRAVDLEVGQQLEVNSGRVQERYRAPRSAPPAPPPGEVRSEAPAPPPAEPRRASRERALVRELLREIEGQAAPAQAPGPKTP